MTKEKEVFFMSDLKNKVSELFTAPFLLAKAAKENPSKSFEQATEVVNDVMEGVLDGVTKGFAILMADLKSKEEPQAPAQPSAQAPQATPEPRVPRTRKKKE